MPISIRAFLLTYPSINIIICAFFLQYPWIFDFIIMQHGRRITLIQRQMQQWKTLLAITKIFTLLTYLLYIFAFPIRNDKEG